jgi:hypothetical protein
MFAFGIDLTVVNVTKDAVGIREAAIPDSANTTRPDPRWMVANLFGGRVPKELVFPNPNYKVADIQEPAIRDTEINRNQFTPPDQIRKWVGEWPTDFKPNPAALMAQSPGKNIDPSVGHEAGAGGRCRLPWACPQSSPATTRSRPATNRCQP